MTFPSAEKAPPSTYEETGVTCGFLNVHLWPLWPCCAPLKPADLPWRSQLTHSINSHQQFPLPFPLMHSFTFTLHRFTPLFVNLFILFIPMSSSRGQQTSGGVLKETEARYRERRNQLSVREEGDHCSDVISMISHRHALHMFDAKTQSTSMIGASPRHGCQWCLNFKQPYRETMKQQEVLCNISMWLSYFICHKPKVRAAVVVALLIVSLMSD